MYILFDRGRGASIVTFGFRHRV